MQTMIYTYCKTMIAYLSQISIVGRDDILKTPMFEVRIASEKNQLCEFQEHTINITPIHNWHKDIEVMFVTNGSGYISYDNETLTMAKGDIIIVNSSILHRTYCDNNHTVTYHYLIIYESFCQEMGIEISEFIFNKKIKSEKAWEIYRELLAVTNEKGTMSKEVYSLKLRRTIISLLAELFENHLSTKDGAVQTDLPSITHVKKAVKFINEHYMERISLDDVAKHCSVCKSYLSREFKKYAGQTLFTYINIVRCKNANALILAGMSVSEAAYKSGFENISYFSKNFQRHVGILPSKVKCDTRQSNYTAT